MCHTLNGITSHTNFIIILSSSLNQLIIDGNLPICELQAINKQLIQSAPGG